MSYEQKPKVFSPEETQAALGRIRDSGVLGSKSRIQKLLGYLVQMEIDGQGEKLKAYTIATEALGRGSDFDPGTDSIVRVEVNRLRQALEHYYNTQGAQESLRINIPKGSYRPRLHAFGIRPPGSAAKPGPAAAPEPVASTALDEASGDAPGHAAQPRTGFRSSHWFAALTAFATLAAVILVTLLLKPGLDPGAPTGPIVLDRTHQLDRNAITVAVLPFRSLSDSARATQLSGGMAKELRSSLSRNQALSLITNIPFNEGTSTEDLRALGRGGQVAYFVTGSVQELSGSLRVAVELLDGTSGEVIWARTYPEDSQKVEAFRDSFVMAVSSDLRPQLYSASKRAISAKDLDDLSAWELYLMATWAPGEALSTLEWEKERIELARRAVTLRPRFGQARAVLADKLAYLAAVDPPSNSDAALKEARLHAQTAHELAPSDADVLFNLAIHYWHTGKIGQATRSMARVLELDPNHVLARILVKTFPYTCSAPPDEVLQAAIAYDAALASDNPVRWVTLTWVSMLHLNRSELDLALAAEQRTHQIFQTPDTVLRMAALLNGLDRAADARDLIAAQRRNWPNIDPGHFAEVTMPRRCHEAADAERTLQLYRDLARDAGSG